MTKETEELPKWRQFIKKYKPVILTAVTAIVGVLAGDLGVLDALKSVFGA